MTGEPAPPEGEEMENESVKHAPVPSPLVADVDSTVPATGPANVID